MEIYRIAKKGIGFDFHVNVNTLWSSIHKLEEVYKDILNNELSYSNYAIPIVTKSLELRNSFFILDGHHRVMESIFGGSTSLMVNWCKDFPYIDAGIGNELPVDKTKVVDFLIGKNIHEDIQNI